MCPDEAHAGAVLRTKNKKIGKYSFEIVLFQSTSTLSLVYALWSKLNSAPNKIENFRTATKFKQ